MEFSWLINFNEAGGLQLLKEPISKNSSYVENEKVKLNNYELYYKTFKLDFLKGKMF